MSTKPIRVGFIGLSSSGWAVNMLGPSLTQPSMRHLYDLVAVCTRSEASASASAEKQAKEVGHPVKAYHEISSIVADPDIDLIVVSITAKDHKAAVLAAINAGKDFFIEWPAGGRIETTLEIAQAAREKGVKSIVGLQGRHSRFANKVKEILASGKIGTVRSTSINALADGGIKVWVPDAQEDLEYYKKSVGVTMLSIGFGHVADTFTSLLGEFATIQSSNATVYPAINLLDKDKQPNGRTYPSEVPDHFSVAGLLKSGVVYNIFYRGGYALTPGRSQFIWEIDGEDGTIRIEGPRDHGSFISLEEPDVYLNGDKVDLGSGLGPNNGAFYSVSSAWKAFAEGRTGEYASIEDAVKNQGILDAIEKSGESGKIISL